MKNENNSANIDKRINLGFIDNLFMELNKTVLECVPTFIITLKETVNKEQLIAALQEALKIQPLFATKLGCEKKYFLEENRAPIKVFQSDLSNRPKSFGNSTNGYLWQVCYHNEKIIFDFCHVMTDGRGMSKFITTVMECYFGFSPSHQPEPHKQAFEAVYDPTVKPLGVKKQEKGFSSKHMTSINNNGTAAIISTIKVNTDSLLSCARKLETTPVSLILPLFARAYRRCLPKNIKNRNVKCGFVVDCQKATGISTCSNFVAEGAITYTDRFDKFDLQTLGTIFRTRIDLFLQPENITHYCTSIMQSINVLLKMKPKFLKRSLLQIVTRIMKKTGSNFYISYIGKLPFSEKLTKQIQDVDLFIWPDTAYCIISMLDFNGTLKMSVGENYKDRALVHAFVQELTEVGLKSDLNPSIEYFQATPDIQNCI